MKIYTVERLDKFDYDFSVELKKCGCFYNKEKALQKAKEVYESMCGEYKDGMARYADEEDEASGKTRIEEDAENGYYFVAFGHDEDYECHNVAVNEYEIEDELSHREKRNVYDELNENYLIEDIKCKLEDRNRLKNARDIITEMSVVRRLKIGIVCSVTHREILMRTKMV